MHVHRIARDRYLADRFVDDRHRVTGHDIRERDDYRTEMARVAKVALALVNVRRLDRALRRAGERDDDLGLGGADRRDRHGALLTALGHRVEMEHVVRVGAHRTHRTAGACGKRDACCRSGDRESKKREGKLTHVYSSYESTIAAAH